MAKLVRVAPGYNAVPLPTGRTYNFGAQVWLTDAQYESLSPVIRQQITLINSRPDTLPAVEKDSPTQDFIDELVERGLQGPAGTPGTPGAAGQTGPQGDKGEKGDVGPQGPAGSGSGFTYVQGPSSADWVIVHNLGVFPPVVVIDSAGTQIQGAVSYPDINTVRIEFTAPFSGTAYLV